ncbi:MAG TPA: IclR family transcriptional regulator [Solirubrobacteraceae bacterium]|jgi:DNA-binding IclR family transcriptional regulator|nr:IclR family transcriptional regulator [Solirubrobacteraceae bacterium]
MSAKAAAERPYRVPAVNRAMAVLRALEQRGPLTLGELITQTGLNRSTCFYLLRTLCEEGVIERDADGHAFRLGIGLVELGAAASEQLTYLGVAKRCLAELLEEMNATFVFYRRVSEEHIVLVDKLERPSRVRITVPLGAQLAIQGGSFGRCFLAHDPPELVDRLLASGLPARTARSVTDPDAFRAELPEVRRRGWAVDHEGFALGISTIAAPLFGPGGEILLALAAVTITSLLDEATTKDWGARLRAACDRIAGTLAQASPPWEGRLT